MMFGGRGGKGGKGGMFGEGGIFGEGGMGGMGGKTGGKMSGVMQCMYQECGMKAPKDTTNETLQCVVDTCGGIRKNGGEMDEDMRRRLQEEGEDMEGSMEGSEEGGMTRECACDSCGMCYKRTKGAREEFCPMMCESMAQG